MNVPVLVGTSTIAFITIASVSITAKAQECSEVLAASRNYLQNVDDRDAKSYFYNQTCKNSGTEVGANFANLQSSFGFSYGNKEQFCSQEAKNFSDVQHYSISTSTVVEKGLEVFYQCMKLKRENKRSYESST